MVLKTENLEIEGKVIKRNIENILYKELNNDEVLTLVGARQVGKTTLLYKIRDHLEKQGQTAGFLTLEDKFLLTDLNGHPKNIFNYINLPGDEKKKYFLLIDEIQYLDDPSNFLKYTYDLYKDRIKLVVTGSSAFYIDKKYKDSLAGRKKVIRISPLTFTEFLVAKGEQELSESVKAGKLLKPEKDKVSIYYREYFKFGGYPKAVLKNELNEKIEVLKELYLSFLKKDILESGVKNEIKFYELLRLLAAQSGSLLNINELSNTLNISREAVENYIYIMEKGFIIRLIRPFHSNIRKELGKMPKVYFLDTGYRNTVLNNYDDIEIRPDKGESLENSLFISLYNRTSDIDEMKFWRTKDNNEVDFIVQEKAAYEVKFNRNNFNPKKYVAFTNLYPNIPLNCVSYSKNYRNEEGLTIFDFLG